MILDIVSFHLLILSIVFCSISKAEIFPYLYFISMGQIPHVQRIYLFSLPVYFIYIQLCIFHFFLFSSESSVGNEFSLKWYKIGK